MAAPLTKRPVRYKSMIIVRVPLGLKAWYERRALEQGVTLSDLVREILQNKRDSVTGDKR